MENKIIEVCNNSLTMRQAAKKLEMPFNTFKRKAKKLGIYISNQGGKGLSKNRYNLTDVFEGKIYMNSNALKKRLIKEGYKENKCEDCYNKGEWNDKHLELELDHINGDSRDNRLENLRILCPNCHSQTPTFRKKKKK